MAERRTRVPPVVADGLGLAQLVVLAAAIGAGLPPRMGPFALTPANGLLTFALIAASLGGRGETLVAMMSGAMALLSEGFACAFLAGCAARAAASGVSDAREPWRQGLLLIGLMGLAVLPPDAPDVIRLAVGLALLAGMSRLPALAVCLLVRLLCVPAAMGGPGLDNGLGGLILLCIAAILACVPLGRIFPPQAALPMVWLWALLAARRADLVETAGAAACALLLAILLMGNPSRRVLWPEGVLRSCLPGAAGFLPLWLGLHALFGLAAAETRWVLPSVALVMLVGFRAAVDGIDMLVPVFGGRGARASSEAGSALPGRGLSRPALPLAAGMALVLAAVPGVVLVGMRPGLAALCGAGALSTVGGQIGAGGGWLPVGRGWVAAAFGTVAGGDGGRWAPFLAFLLMTAGFCAVALATRGAPGARRPSGDGGIRPDLVMPFLHAGRHGGVRFAWVWLRRGVALRRAGRRLAARVARSPAMVGPRAAAAPMSLGTWLLLVALGLAVLGWRG